MRTLTKFLLAILAWLLVVFFLTGCSTFYTPLRTDELSGLKLNLLDDAGKLKESAKIIETESVKIKVKQQAAKIAVVADDLVRKNATAEKIKEYTESLEQQVEALINDKTKRVELFFFWGIVAGSLIFAGGIAFIIVCYAAGVPNLAGLALQISLFGGAIVLFSGLAYYYFWLGVTGIAILVAVFVVLIIIKAIKDNKSLLEVVRTSEVYKQVKDSEEAKKLVNIIQTPVTKKVVDSIRTKDNLKVA